MPLDDLSALQAALQALPKIDYCLHGAAYTAVDKAEAESELAFCINEQATAVLAQQCETWGATMVYISTDYAYHNAENRPLREEDACSPKSVYARSKYAGEQAAAKHCSRSLIVRTSWVYSSHGHNFVKTMLRLSEQRESISVVADQIGTPTYAADLARALMTMLTKIDENTIKPLWGSIYNYSNEGAASWYDFAQAIFEERARPCTALPIRTEQYPTPAERPPYSLLDKTKIKAAFGLSIPHWRDALRRCLRLLPLLLMLLFAANTPLSAQKKWQRLTQEMQKNAQPFFFYSWQTRADSAQNLPATTGDNLQIHYTISRLKGKTEERVLSSHEQPEPVFVPLPDLRQDIFFTAALRLMRKGDKLRVIVPADSIRPYLGEMDKHFKRGEAVIFLYEIVDIQRESLIRAQAEANSARADSLRRRMQLEVNDLITGRGKSSYYETIPSDTDSLDAHARTLMYYVYKQGKGIACKAAKSYTVQYLCLTYPAGQLVDDSFRTGKTIRVNTKNPHQYILGFILGCGELQAGSEAVLWIPSRLAYGSKGAGTTIPPNADLLFWVEILSVEP